MTTCQKARISSVTTQVDQSQCFFATLIEHFSAPIEKSPKILNPELKDLHLFLYLHGRKINSKGTFSRDAAHIIDLQLNILK